MKKRKRLKQNDIFSLLRWKGFLILLIFALCLGMAAYKITAHFTDQNPDINDALKEYLTSSFSTNVNNLYLYDIDKPMEDFMDSSAVTSFFFCSEQYPPTEELISYIADSMTAMAEESEYITASAIYASTSNTFISSHWGENEEETAKYHDFLDTMIYNYNSSSLDINKIAGNAYNTFLFKYQDYIVFSKDLTTLSGSSHSTMFFLMDEEAFSAFIYQANEMIPYKVSIYDAHNVLLFSNSEQSGKEVYTHLLNFTADGASDADSSQYIYCSSDITGMQYLLEMDLITLPSETTDPPLLYICIVLASFLLAALLFGLLYFTLRKPAAALSHTAEQLEIETPRSFAAFSHTMEQKISGMVTENSTLKGIVEATSSEAVSHLFAKIIVGETVNKEEAGITLSNTGYGFQLDDIYIAGILHQTVTDFITASTRQHVLNMLSSVFEKFKEKKQCNLCAFLHDEKSFVIIGSFPAGTSMAQGKARINELTSQIREGITLLNAPLTIAFGHMYNSILDLGFSYNEAFKAMHYYQAEAPSSAPSMPALHYAFPSAQDTQLPSPAESSDAEAPQEAIPDIPDPYEQLERRASQIAQLIWDGKMDGLSSLLDRTMTLIFDTEKSAKEQNEQSKQLISVVTSHMLSYPFVNDSHLSNVLDGLPLDDELPAEERQQNLLDALGILCTDFSEALKKLRNPYIIAAQEYIEQNYGNPDLSLEEIAENLKIAPNYLSTIFSKNLGVKLFEYINEYRLDKSIRLLLDTDKTVNDISGECGFGIYYMLNAMYPEGPFFLIIAAVFAFLFYKNASTVSVSPDSVCRSFFGLGKKEVSWDDIKEVGLIGENVFSRKKTRTGHKYIYFSPKEMTKKQRFDMIVKWPPKKMIYVEYQEKGLEYIMSVWGKELKTYNVEDLFPDTEDPNPQSPH